VSFCRVCRRRQLIIIIFAFKKPPSYFHRQARVLCAAVSVARCCLPRGSGSGGIRSRAPHVSRRSGTPTRVCPGWRGGGVAAGTTNRRAHTCEYFRTRASPPTRPVYMLPKCRTRMIFVYRSRVYIYIYMYTCLF